MGEYIDIKSARIIMGNNFIGPEELHAFSKQIGISFTSLTLKQVPVIPFRSHLLEKCRNDYLLILGSDMAYDGEPLTIFKMREFFGIDPNNGEPCFYNQDWYLNEKFLFKRMQSNWFLVRKELNDKTRGKDPVNFNKITDLILPSAVSLCYTFFAQYFIRNEILWVNDYVWCADLDHNEDRIYVGRYKDPLGTNKNGFSIHRHLRITENYGISNYYGE